MNLVRHFSINIVKKKCEGDKLKVCLLCVDLIGHNNDKKMYIEQSRDFQTLNSQPAYRLTNVSQIKIYKIDVYITLCIIYYILFVMELENHTWK